MAIDPRKLGYEAELIRPFVNEKMDLIDQNLANPLWIRDNNKASASDPQGTFKFQFYYMGHLNKAEISTIEEGWKNAGWTEVVCKNIEQQTFQTRDDLRWMLYLAFYP